MGQQISLTCAIHDVMIYDISEEILEKSIKGVEMYGKQLVALKKNSSEEIEKAITLIQRTTDLEIAAKDVDIISESVPEDPKIKGKIFNDLHKLCRKDTIFTTNTSTLLPSMFADATGRPEKLCALHFHAITTNIVDVMPHPKTADSTIEIVKEFAEKIGQVAILLKKEHGGYVFNNMLSAILDSALTLASNEIASIDDIDKSFTGILNSYAGPFRLMDQIGIETVWKITAFWAAKTKNPQSLKNAEFLKKYVDAGKIGIKTGEGFYSYSK